MWHTAVERKRHKERIPKLSGYSVRCVAPFNHHTSITSPIDNYAQPLCACVSMGSEVLWDQQRPVSRIPKKDGRGVFRPVAVKRRRFGSGMVWPRSPSELPSRPTAGGHRIHSKVLVLHN